MTRRIAVVALAALAGGCVPTGKDSQPPPAATPPTSGPPPAQTPAEGPPGEPPLPLPGDDPRHAALRSYRAAVGGREEEIAAALLRLDAAAGKVAAAPADRTATLDEFRKLAPVLRDASRALLADHRAVLEATESLAKDLRHGPTAFRQAARAWRDRAEDYTLEAFRQNALGYAEALERYGDLLPARRQEVQGFAAELREQLPFLRELVSSLEDLSRFLEQHPGRGLPDPRPEYVAQLRSYATPLTAFQGQLRKYLTTLRGRGAADANPATPAATPGPDTPTPPPAEPPPAGRPATGASAPPGRPRVASDARPVVVTVPTPVVDPHPAPVVVRIPEGTGKRPWPATYHYSPYGYPPCGPAHAGRTR